MDQIDAYLDELAVRLRIGPARVRRLLAEAEEHLREAAARDVAAGTDQQLAEHRAVERFGTPRQVAAAANGSTVSLLGPLAQGGAHLAAVASVTVLAGSLLAHLVAAVTSTTSAFGLPRGALPSPARIGQWVAAQPGVHDWHAAAASENADDTLILRGGFALVCLVGALVILRVGRRRASPPRGGIIPAIGMTAFGGAGVLLLAGGVSDTYLQAEWGRGLWFSDATVALLAAAAYALILLRRAPAV
ncbi:MAG: hypothetical protein ABI776_05390 [Nocardioidaceae bacterium]